MVVQTVVDDSPTCSRSTRSRMFRLAIYAFGIYRNNGDYPPSIIFYILLKATHAKYENGFGYD